MYRSSTPPAAARAARPPAGGVTTEIAVDTSTPQARRQYDANVAFASSYEPRGAARSSPRPRVLVSGFGRFGSIADNAAGRAVSALVPEAAYPETRPPLPGEVDPPAPQLSVGAATLALPEVGEVDVRAMILPVSWDLAAILLAKEIEAFAPSFVLMNGVAGPRQPLWLELGATNRAADRLDGSSRLRPSCEPGQPYAKIIASAAPSEEARGNLLSWSGVRRAASEAIGAQGDAGGARRFGDIVRGAALAGYPRASNTYVCNNLTYVIGWLMDHPGDEVALLRAGAPVEGAKNEVRVSIRADFRAVPRVFVHWPSALDREHHAASAEVMKAIISAQLRALSFGDEPTVGDDALADSGIEGGEVY